MTDINIHNHGSIVLLEAVSTEGQEWLDANVGNDETQYWHGAVVCEPRYVEAIIEGACADGLEVAL